MNRLLSGGMALFAGLLSLPAPASVFATKSTPTADYRNDPRLEQLRKFFGSCPAAKYAETFLAAADGNDLDWRLLPSISFVESTGGKSAPHNNLFGWNSGQTHFRSPAASIHEVGYRLAHSALYKAKSLDRLLATYNPVGHYAQRVKSVMRQIAITE